MFWKSVLNANTILRGLVMVTTIALCGDLMAQTPPPERCPGSSELSSIYKTDWESGLSPWITGTYEIGKPSTFDTPDWSISDDLPTGRNGRAAFVANLNIGDCASDDESGVLTLESPSIPIPSEIQRPRISIDHWFQIEDLWDGGNIKISVNGGEYELVPGSTMIHAPYNGKLNDALDEFGLIFNLNPLAGEEAFTGTMNGGAVGTWEQTQIDLTGIAQPGDIIKLRLDFGIDDCGGEVGWYVDDLEVFSCIASTPEECGNGILESSEQCDDGNLLDGDGCSNVCLVEDGWSCSSTSPSECTQDVSQTSLTLEKIVINDNGGTSVPPDWTLSANGPSGFSGTGPQVYSPEGFEAGIYRLSESGDINGYSSSAWNCDGGTMVDSNAVSINQGESVICTITNNDIEPSLTLVKQVINDNGGSSIPSDWLLSASGPVSFSGQGPEVTNGLNFRAGTYVLSESGEPDNYKAGAWMCEGGSQPNNNTISLNVGESVKCTITNDDLPPGATIDIGHSGAWYNPATAGQGLLLDVEPDKQFIFLAWFTYTTDDSLFPNEQHWLTAEGLFNGNEAELILYESSGGQFDDPREVTTLPVGSVILSFSDCINGTLYYTFDDRDLSGSFPITRAIPGSENVCHELSGETATEAIQINSGMDGAWYDPETSGQGFLIDAYPGGEFMFVAWFTYGDQNASGLRWLTGEGAIVEDQGALTIYNTTGGSFDDGTVTSWEDVGTMNIEFSDCSSATIQYSIPEEGLEGTIDIIRAVPGTEILCETLE